MKIGFSTLVAIVLIAPVARSEFRKTPTTTTTRCDFRLARAAGIPYRCLAHVNQAAKLPLWQPSLNFQFGRLQPQQWQQLVQNYATWHHPAHLAPYHPDQRYELIDFLPPLVQALDRHQFQAQTQTVSTATTTMKVSLVANCWGTLYEILRLARSPDPQPAFIFLAGMQPMLTILRQNSAIVSRQAQPGDILLIYHQHQQQDYLDHVALVVDQNLYFEKAGTGDHVPYRLVDEATLKRTWRPDVFTFEIRRPYATLQLPPPAEAFGLSKQSGSVSWPYTAISEDGQQLTADQLPHVTAGVTYFGIQPIPLQRQYGRTVLAESAYR